jgi:hypothetical protein
MTNNDEEWHKQDVGRHSTAGISLIFCLLAIPNPMNYNIIHGIASKQNSNDMPAVMCHYVLSTDKA